jgi:membrane protein implicated in regulation of membrane protease activity
VHVLRNKIQLQLTTLELFDTHTKIHGYVILITIGTLAIFTALLLPLEIAGLSGFVYVLIGIVLTVYYAKRAKKRKNLQHEHEVRVENIVE